MLCVYLPTEIDSFRRFPPTVFSVSKLVARRTLQRDRMLPQFGNDRRYTDEKRDTPMKISSFDFFFRKIRKSGNSDKGKEFAMLDPRVS